MHDDDVQVHVRSQVKTADGRCFDCMHDYIPNRTPVYLPMREDRDDDDDDNAGDGSDGDGEGEGDGDNDSSECKYDVNSSFRGTTLVLVPPQTPARAPSWTTGVLYRCSYLWWCCW